MRPRRLLPVLLVLFMFRPAVAGTTAKGGEQTEKPQSPAIQSQVALGPTEILLWEDLLEQHQLAGKILWDASDLIATERADAEAAEFLKRKMGEAFVSVLRTFELDIAAAHDKYLLAGVHASRVRAAVSSGMKDPASEESYQSLHDLTTEAMHKLLGVKSRINTLFGVCPEETEIPVECDPVIFEILDSLLAMDGIAQAYLTLAEEQARGTLEMAMEESDIPGDGDGGSSLAPSAVNAMMSALSNLPVAPPVPGTEVTMSGSCRTYLGNDGWRYFIGDNGDNICGGTNGNDKFIMGAGNDWVDGHGGPDRFEMDGGDDTANGGGGSDTMFGSGGADQLLGDAGDDWIAGEDGHDTLKGNGDVDSLLGGEGNDVVDGNENTGWMAGEGGDDILRGGGAGDELWGGVGHDTLRSDGGEDRLRGEGGSDTLIGGQGPDSIMAGSGDDQAWGDDEPSTGEGGDDRIFMEEGNDVARADGGADLIYGASGDDELRGGALDDRIYADDGIDTVYADDGNDVVFTGEGGINGNPNSVYAGEGNDHIYGGPNWELVYGQSGTDRVEDNGYCCLGINDLDSQHGDADIFYGGEGSQDWADLKEGNLFRHEPTQTWHRDVRDTFWGERGDDECPDFDFAQHSEVIGPARLHDVVKMDEYPGDGEEDYAGQTDCTCATSLIECVSGAAGAIRGEMSVADDSSITGTITVSPDDLSACAHLDFSRSATFVGSFSAVGSVAGPGAQTATIREVVPISGSGTVWDGCSSGTYEGASAGAIKYTLRTSDVGGAEYYRVVHCRLEEGEATCH
jgi:Ca2+-binding RTX toxin-like protein